MKIAFSHPTNEHAAQLLGGLAVSLAGQQLISWPSEEPPPADDIRILLALGPVRREQLVLFPKLELVQTVSAGFESVDVEAASSFGIWVSNAPAGLTGNAASVAEFADMLLIGASRRFPQALITPHIAGDTDVTLRGTLSYLAKVVGAWESGQKPESLVNQPSEPRKVLS